MKGMNELRHRDLAGILIAVVDRFEGLSRNDHGSVPADDDADVQRASDPLQPGTLFVADRQAVTGELKNIIGRPARKKWPGCWRRLRTAPRGRSIR